MIERRYVNLETAGVTVETREDGQPRAIVGHAAVFYDGTERTEYDFMGLFRERIMPGAFRRAIAEQDDPRALFNHDPNVLLGRRSAGSLALREDALGLAYEIPVDPNDPDHARVLAKIQRGDLRGSSFSFQVKEENHRKENGREIREIRDVELFDVGPVTFPAYEATDTSLRSWAEGWLAGQRQEAELTLDPKARQVKNVTKRPALARLRRWLQYRA